MKQDYKAILYVEDKVFSVGIGVNRRQARLAALRSQEAYNFWTLNRPLCRIEYKEYP